MRRIMFVENKGGGLLQGAGRIGWVVFSKSRRSFYYQGRRLEKTRGYKYNCVDVESGEEYWVSGPHQVGNDLLYGGVVEIDDDAREEYWTDVRKEPENKHLTRYRSGPSTRTSPARVRP